MLGAFMLCVIMLRAFRLIAYAGCMLGILLVSGTPLCCIHMCFSDQCHSYHCSYTNCCRGRNIVELPAHIDSLDIYKLERLSGGGIVDTLKPKLT